MHNTQRYYVRNVKSYSIQLKMKYLLGSLSFPYLPSSVPSRGDIENKRHTPSKVFVFKLYIYIYTISFHSQ